MHLEELQAVGFRSYAQLSARFSSHVNVLVGANGKGKTNVLDMIYLLSMCKLPNHIPDGSCIRHGDRAFSLHGKYTTDDGNCEVSLGVRSGVGKVVKFNGQPYRRLSEHIGRIPLVAVYPHDTNLIDDGGDLRRRFMNAAISQYDQQYLPSLATYERALQQRNRFLRGDLLGGEAFLDVLDILLAEAAQPVYASRAMFCESLNPLFQESYSYLAPEGERVQLEYRSQLHSGDFSSLLRGSREQDMRMQYTTVGLHRDNLGFTLNGYTVRREGSQGQQKTFIIALRLALFRLLRKHIEHTPILLLDDVFDRLDAERVDRLVSYVSGEGFGQVFITDTDENRIGSIFPTDAAEWRLFEAVGGELIDRGEI